MRTLMPTFVKDQPRTIAVSNILCIWYHKNTITLLSPFLSIFSQQHLHYHPRPSLWKLDLLHAIIQRLDKRVEQVLGKTVNLLNLKTYFLLDERTVVDLIKTLRTCHHKNISLSFIGTKKMKVGNHLMGQQLWKSNSCIATSILTSILSMIKAKLEKFLQREVEELQIIFPAMFESAQSDFNSGSYEVLEKG